MSNRLSKEKAQAIAVEYCKNGHKKVLGLLAVGYSQNYAKSGKGCKVYDNTLVKQAISSLEVKSAKKAVMTIERVQTMYEEDREFASKVNQAGARVSATTGIARLYGMDKDAGGKDTVAVINVINYAGAAGVSPPEINSANAHRQIIDAPEAIEGQKEEEDE